MVNETKQFAFFQGQPPLQSEAREQKQQQDIPRSQNVFNYALTTNAQLIALPDHYGVVIVNTGGQILQFSPDGQSWQDFLLAGAGMGMDNHQMKLFFLRSKAATTTVQITSW